MDLQQYLPVILFILVGVAVGVAPQVLGFLFGPNRPGRRPRTAPTSAASRPSRTRA
jgi:NADH:ubiquinone oxidoreductase subunit 3 (subunit A)